jgi:molybdopterin-biosynthesis enzyme MoeA-like protein
MKGLLATKDCLRAITEAADPNSSKAMGLMIMCVEEQHLATIEQTGSAAAAWAALEALYRQTSTANLIQLRKQLTTLEKKADESIPQYMARARSIADQIRAATATEVNTTDLVLAILAGLPSEYIMVRTVIENMAALPSMAELQAKLLLVEKQQPESDGDTASTRVWTQHGNPEGSRSKTTSNMATSKPKTGATRTSSRPASIVAREATIYVSAGLA